MFFNNKNHFNLRSSSNPIIRLLFSLFVIISIIATFFLGAIIFILFVILAGFIALFLFFKNKGYKNLRAKEKKNTTNRDGRILDGEYSIVDEEDPS